MGLPGPGLEPASPSCPCEAESQGPERTSRWMVVGSAPEQLHRRLWRGREALE